MNPVAWVLDALKTWPEKVSLPESVDGADALKLAEARSRLVQFIQVATELRRLVDADLAAKLDGKALRYGEDIIRPSYRGAAKVTDPEAWWRFIGDVLDGLADDEDEADARLLSALYPASSVRLGGLKLLAELSGMSEQAIKETFVVYDPPTSPLQVTPRSKAPKFLQDLEEGEMR